MFLHGMAQWAGRITAQFWHFALRRATNPFDYFHKGKGQSRLFLKNNFGTQQKKTAPNQKLYIELRRTSTENRKSEARENYGQQQRQQQRCRKQRKR